MLNNQKIEQFVEEYSRSKICVKTTIRAIMNMAYEAEGRFGKSFTEFDKEEALDMYKSVKAVSVNSLMNKNLVLSSAHKWENYTRCVNEANIYETITKDDLKLCVDASKRKLMMLNRAQIDDIESELLNDTDRAVVEMLFRGAGGQWAKELTYLMPEQVSRADMCVYFKTGKKILIDENVYNLLQRTFNEKEMVSYTPGSTKISKVIPQGIYKMRANTLYTNVNQNDEADAERRFRWLQRKLYIIGDYLGLEKLTVSSIQNSGLFYSIQVAMDDMDIGFRDFIKTKESKRIARQYDIYSELYVQILQDKFGDYFI